MTIPKSVYDLLSVRDGVWLSVDDPSFIAARRATSASLAISRVRHGRNVTVEALRTGRRVVAYRLVRPPRGPWRDRIRACLSGWLS